MYREQLYKCIEFSDCAEKIAARFIASHVDSQTFYITRY